VHKPVIIFVLKKQRVQYINDSAKLKLSTADDKSKYVTNKPAKLKNIIQQWNQLVVTNESKLGGI